MSRLDVPDGLPTVGGQVTLVCPQPLADICGLVAAQPCHRLCLRMLTDILLGSY